MPNGGDDEKYELLFCQLCRRQKENHSSEGHEQFLSASNFPSALFVGFLAFRSPSSPFSPKQNRGVQFFLFFDALRCPGRNCIFPPHPPAASPQALEVLEGPNFPSYFWFLILSFSLLALRPRHEFSSRLRHTGHTQQPPHTGWHKYNHIKRKKSPSMYLLSFNVASP